MGQISCIEKVSEDFYLQSVMKIDLSSLTYREFLLRIYELNVITQPMSSKIGKKFVFAPIKDTESSFFWKAAIRIGCLRINSSTNRIESYRILTLPQFVHTYQALMYQHFASKLPPTKYMNKKINRKKSKKEGSKNKEALLTMKVCNRFGEIEKIKSDLEECCICMDKKPNIMLPCTHCFCLPCIETWKASRKNCPLCREETSENLEETWIIAEAPDPSEIDSELQKTLLNLTNNPQN
ncbi:RING finger protein 141-like [Centruroides sculpturatus]|uniref:RING finger protein 141-like n=1 Tax=Centruroides sculpturatus TaxID=218467 RepID=UPI000C6E8304|nr:RING finger protein 141-like [Centruroides sculpturatus]XP_023210679.1 RING finger protein 141-like [Centruroides sculpturatus]